MFKNFRSAKSVFSTFLFLNRFQLWLYILGGYHWGNLCDMGWRLSEIIFFTLVTFVTYTHIPLEWQGSSLRANLNPSASWLSEHVGMWYIYQIKGLLKPIWMGLVMVAFDVNKLSKFWVFLSHLLTTYIRVLTVMSSVNKSGAILMCFDWKILYLSDLFCEFWGNILNPLFMAVILIPAVLRLVEFEAQN